MILGANEKVIEIPAGTKFDYVKNDKGWLEQIAVLGTGFAVPVLTSEVASLCLICDLEDNPLRVIEPSILG